jgi:hypothetical protein
VRAAAVDKNGDAQDVIARRVDVLGGRAGRAEVIGVPADDECGPATGAATVPQAVRVVAAVKTTIAP